MADKIGNVVSLFDGPSTGQYALNEAGIGYDNYFASEIDKHAIKVTMAHYPKTIQLGDVTTVKKENLPDIQLLIGGSPCFVAGTKVITDLGLKNIEKVRIGDMVLTHKGRYRTVAKTGGTSSPTITVRAKSILPTTTTKDHPYYVRSSYNGVLSEPKWVNAGDLKRDHRLGVPVDTETLNTYNLTEDECLFLGKCWFKNELNFDNERKKIISYHIYDKDIILSLPKHLLKKVIEGFFDLDDSVDITHIKVHVINESTALTLSMAILKVYGRMCSLSVRKPSIGKCDGYISVNSFETYLLEYYHGDYDGLKPEIIDDIAWVYFLGSEETGLEEKVYNLEVEEDNSYTANLAIVHNCQGFSFGGKQLNFDDPRSKLFFEFVRLRDELNPKYWMLENVLMKDEFIEVINKYLGVEPVLINSDLVSAQNRKRLYWSNFKIEQPKKIDTSISDIIEEGEYKYPASIRGRKIDGEEGFNQTLQVRKDITKSNCLTTVCKDNVLSKLPPGNYKDAFKNKHNYRYYTLKESCRLQTLPDDYFDNIVSEHQAKRMLGNGWTAKVIESNFRGMI